MRGKTILTTQMMPHATWTLWVKADQWTSFVSCSATMAEKHFALIARKRQEKGRSAFPTSEPIRAGTPLRLILYFNRLHLSLGYLLYQASLTHAIGKSA